MENSKKQGEVISYDKDEKIVEIAWYTDGNLDCKVDISNGTHSYYHDEEETILWQKYTIKDGKPTGEWVIHHGNGQMQEYRKYRKGMRISTWKSWHPDGNLWWEETYKNGMKNGICRRWRYDKVLEYEGMYKDDKKHGLWVTYYDNGVTEYIRVYKNNRLTGTEYRYHKETGKLWSTSEYKNNKRHGKFQQYDWSVKQQKIVVLDAEYKNDNRHGIRKGYFTNGAKWFESNYIDGIQVDDCTYWQIDGTPKIVCSYNESGKQEGKWTEYFMDGRKRAEGMMKNGEMDGKWTFWYNTGEKECEFERKDNVFVNATVYHDNGKIKDKFKV